MRRRKTLAALGSIASLGMFFGSTSVAADSSEEQQPGQESTSLRRGDPFNVRLGGAATIESAERENDTESVNTSLRGSMFGTIRGAYEGETSATVTEENGSASGPLSGQLTLVSPDGEEGSNSTYVVDIEGKILGTGRDFRFEGTFESTESTGRFEGTGIEGDIIAKKDIGFVQHTQLRGNVIAE